MKKKILNAFYDIQVNPTSFDICKFIVLAEQQRKLKGLGSVHTFFVPNGKEWARSDDEHLEMQQKWRLNNILIPALSVMPTFTGYTVCTPRAEAKNIEKKISGTIFPSGYTYENPIPCFAWADIAINAHNEIPSIRANPQALAYVQKWLDVHCKNLKPVSITLREMSLEKQRNSDVTAWLKFAKELPAKGYFPIILRDTALTMELPGKNFSGLTLFNEVSLNLELRTALYQLCYINAFVANGPAELCLFNTKVNYLYFLKMYDGDGKRLYEHPGMGLPHKGRFPVGGPHQLMVWDDDTYTEIKRHFWDLTALLETENKQIEFFKSRDYFPPNLTSPLIYLELLSKAKCTLQVDQLVHRLEKEQQITPDIGYYWRGRVRLTSEDNKEAIVLLKKAIKENNSESMYFLELGNAYNKYNGEFDLGMECLEKARELDPEKPNINVLITIVYFKLGNIESAEKNALKCLEKGILHNSIYEILSDISKSRGDYQKAVEYLTARHGL